MSVAAGLEAPDLPGRASVADWSVLEEPEIGRVVKMVARKVADRSGGVVDVEDAEQEAWLIAATRADDVRTRVAQGPALLNTWLTWVVGDAFKTERERAARQSSADVEELDENGEVPVESEYLKGFRESDGEDYAVEVRSL